MAGNAKTSTANGKQQSQRSTILSSNNSDQTLDEKRPTTPPRPTDRSEKEDDNHRSDWDTISHDEADENGHLGYRKDTYSGHLELKIGGHKLFSRSFVGSKYSPNGESIARKNST